MSDLITIKELTKKKGPSYAIIGLILGCVTLTIFYFYFITTNLSPINTAVKVNDIKIKNKTYDLIKETLRKDNDNIQDSWINIFISDTIILSEKAKELNINIDTEGENYSKLVEKYGDFAERVLLRENLEKSLQKNAIITEDEIYNFYENYKDEFYINNSNIEYYAVQLDHPISPDYKRPNNIPIKNGSIHLMRKYGIYNPKKHTYLIDESENSYKYIIITKCDIEYIPIDKIKDKIKDVLYKQKTDGVISEYLNNGKLTYNIKYYK